MATQQVARPRIFRRDRSCHHVAMEPTKDKQADPPLLPGIEPLEPQSIRTRPSRQRMRRRTGSGDRQLDERIRELVETVDVADRDLLEDIVETSFRMARTANRGELKLVSRSFRELGRSFRIFAP